MASIPTGISVGQMTQMEREVNELVKPRGVLAFKMFPSKALMSSKKYYSYRLL